MRATSGGSGPRGAVQYLHAIRVHWVLILTLTGLAIATAGAVTLTAAKKYQSSADVQIQALPPYSGDPFQGFDVFRAAADGSSPTVAAARLFGSPQYKNLTRRRLGRRGTAVALSVTPLSQSDIVTVEATAPTAALAATAANTYAAVIVDQRKTLFEHELTQRMQQIAAQMAAIPQKARNTNPTYASLAGQLGTLRSWVGSSDPTVQILTPATVPGGAFWPRPKLTLAIALAIGLLLGLACAVTLELVNPRVTSEDDLVLSHRLPILARIPRMQTRVANEYLLGRAHLPAGVWRNYRTLRAVLSNAGTDGGYPRSILVTSASPGDGKTMSAVNIAIAIASAELSVTLVDADFHRPMIATIFNIPNRTDGVARLLANPDVPVTGTVDVPRHPKLKLLLSTREQLRQPHLFDPKRFEKALIRLQQESDVVVIDAPPVPDVAEVLALTTAVDAVIVCVRIGHTRRDRLDELRELFARAGVAPLGFVVTSRKRPDLTVSEYGYATDLTTTGPLTPDPLRDSSVNRSRQTARTPDGRR
jgi:tyrosine-protein kinase